MAFLAAFDVILFDMNGTFMFERDRFSAEQDYDATYRALDGTGVSRTAVTTATEHERTGRWITMLLP